MKGIQLEARSKFSSRMSQRSISSVRQTINEYEEAEKEFSAKMTDASIRERARLEAEMIYREEIRRNGGK